MKAYLKAISLLHSAAEAVDDAVLAEARTGAAGTGLRGTMRPCLALLLCALSVTRAQYKPGSFESAVVRYRDKATNTITILEANEAHADLMLNWLLHARRLRLGGFVVVALDEVIHSQLQALEMPCFYDPTGDPRERPRPLFSTMLPTPWRDRCAHPTHSTAPLTLPPRPHSRLWPVQFESTNIKWMSDSYNAIVLHKWDLVLQALHVGVNVLLSDTDVIWLRSPFSDLLFRQQGCDILGSTNAQVTNVPFCRRETVPPRPFV